METKENELVSIIVPVYNVEKYIVEKEHKKVDSVNFINVT